MVDDLQTSFHACVIGAGPGGYVAAIRLAQRGLHVALIEKNAIGGVCLNWGCIPSKALIHAAGVFDDLSRAGKMGIRVDNPQLDFACLIGWKEDLVQKLQGGIRRLLDAHGVTLIAGEASFLAANRLSIRSSSEAAPQTLEADKILIATGGGAQAIPGLPVDGRFLLDVRDLLALNELPARLAIVGGGVIGLEMAMAFSRLGAHVSILEALPEILPTFDPDCRQALLRAIKRRKIALKTGIRASVELTGDDGVVLALRRAEDGDDAPPERLTADKVLIAAGRAPNTQTLDLMRAGLTTDEGGFIPVDTQRRTRVANIFAIGDVTRGPQLAHRASHEGLVAAAAMAGDAASQMDARAIPAAIYTEPELAAVGMTEAEARAAGRDVKTGVFPFQASGRAMTLNAAEGLVKLVADAQTDALLGAHIAGPHAAELIAEAALAIELGATAADLALTVHGHPTLGESLMEAAEAIHRQAIHVFHQ